MGTLSKPDRATYFGARSQRLRIPESRNPIRSPSRASRHLKRRRMRNEYLGLLAPVASFPTIAAAGASLTQGEIYHGARLRSWCGSRMFGLNMIRIPCQRCLLCTGWMTRLTGFAGEQVYKGTQRTFDSVLYEAIQEHVTQSDWTPPAVPALWEVVEEQGGGTTWVDTGVTIAQLVGAGIYRYLECRHSR